MKRICKVCKEEKDFTDFHITNTTTTTEYRSHRCKKCAVLACREKRHELREWFEDYKSILVCEECGEDRMYVLDFHHKDPEEKDYNIGGMINLSFSKKRILEEIAKCKIMCANCHREFHYLEILGA